MKYIRVYLQPTNNHNPILLPTALLSNGSPSCSQSQSISLTTSKNTLINPSFGIFKRKRGASKTAIALRILVGN